MTTAPAQTPPPSLEPGPTPREDEAKAKKTRKAKTAPHRSLTRGQITVLIIAIIPMIAVGLGGAIGTYANAAAELKRSETAIGVVAAGEGATLVAAIVMIGVTMLGQAAPLIARAALWILPAAASTMGIVIAPHLKEAVVYGLTPLAMTAAAEGISFLSRRIVAHTSGVDVEAQRRNSEIMREIAFHAAQAERHPDEKVRKSSALTAWKLMRKVGGGDAELGSGLIAVQRTRLTQGADVALMAMLTGTTEPTHALPMSRAIEPGEPAPEPTPELTGSSTLVLGSHSEPIAPDLRGRQTIIQPTDQHILREPVLIPSEPALAKTNQTAPETAPGESSEPVELEPGADEKEQQITTLAHRIRTGERLTKTTAAQILGVSPATAGRRLKDARDRIGEGTGFYA